MTPGATFLLLLRRGGTIVTVEEPSQGARVFCVVAMGAYTPGAAVAEEYNAGAAREQTYQPGAAVTEGCK